MPNEKPGLIFLKIIILLFSTLASVVILGFLIVKILNTAGNLYELQHPIPLGEDDLGGGLVVLAYSLIIVLASVPLSLLLIKLFQKILSKLLRIISD